MVGHPPSNRDLNHHDTVITIPNKWKLDGVSCETKVRVCETDKSLLSKEPKFEPTSEVYKNGAAGTFWGGSNPTVLDLLGSEQQLLGRRSRLMRRSCMRLAFKQWSEVNHRKDESWMRGLIYKPTNSITATSATDTTHPRRYNSLTYGDTWDK